MHKNELYQRINSVGLMTDAAKRKLAPFVHCETGGVHNLPIDDFVVVADVMLNATFRVHI